MSIEDANSNRTSASAGSCSTAEDVLDEIKSWIQSNDSAKFYSYAVAHIKSKVKRDLFCLEATWVERQYVKTVLEMWLRQSLKRAFEYLEDEATDVSTEMSVILDELNLINCFEDIRSKLNGATSRLKDWCDGGPLHESPHFKCQYLQLILEQRDLFSTMPRFVFLVSSYLKQFKTLCIEKIFARCLNDIAKEETSGEKNLNFIFSLNELFEVADEDIRIQNILEANIPENYVTVGWENEDQTGQDFINKLVEIIAISSNELGKELPQWFALLQSDNQWTPKLQLLTKETFKKFLLPMKTEIYVKDEDGREVIFVYGITVFISKIIQEMLKLKRDNPDVQEIQIVGLKSVHVDCDLESKDWHGINVGVVTHNLYVDRDNVLWDVSGKNGNEMAGELGQPGESGGNVHIICSEMINAEQWTLVCDGGDGSDGLNGGDGQIGPDGKTARKWSEDNFKKSFPSMSTFDTGENTGPYSENAVKTVLTALETILPKKNRTHKSTDIEPEHRGSFFVEGTANDGSRITASYYQSKTKRQTLILCKGSKVGSGGYGGTIIYEFVGAGREPIGVPFVGKEKRKATAVRMDVYETKGSDGTVGEAAGDVGFIHNLDTSLEYAVDNLEGRFIGFRNEVSLEIKYSKTKLIREQCDSENNTFAKLSKKEYASIEPCKPRSFYQIQSLRSTIKAVKKKAIIHQNLAQHLAPINERKQMTQSFQAMFCNPKEHETSSIEQLIKQTEMKEAQLHQLTSQSSQRMEKIGTIRYVKPALKNTHNDLNRATNYLPNRKSIGRRPVDSRSKLPADVRCLDILPTVGGVDSALNSIFGRVNSDGFYLCNNTRTFRLRLAQFVRDLENQTEVLALVGQFVLRMKNVDQLDFPVACGIKPAYIKHQKENGQNNPYNWEEVIKIEELFQEYAKSIELPSSALDSAELKLLARIHEITIDVYEDQLSSFKFKESFNPKKKDKHFVLYEGGGEWRRLEANQKMQYFCELIHQDLFEHKPIQNESYQKLMKWVEKNCTDQQIITSIKKLNPEYGETPDKLFDILIFQNSIPTEQQGCLEQEDKALAEKLAPNLGLLSEWVLEYNRRNISPIFYLQIAKEFVPSEWKYEFVLLELKELLTKFLGDADNYNWEEDMIACLKKFHERMPSLFSLLLKNLASTDCCSKVEPEQLLRLFQMLGEESDGYEAGTISEHQWSELPLNDWFYQLRSNVWQTKINQLSVTEGNTAKDTKRLKKEIVFKLLKLEYKNGEEFCNEFINGITSLETAANKLQNILNPGRRSQTESDQMSVQINVEEIISTMMTNMPQNKNFPKQYPDMLAEIKDKVMESKSEVNSTLDDKSTKKLIQTWMKNGLELTSQVELAQYLSVYDYAVQQTCTKKGDEEKFRLRDTQRVAITAMLTNKYLKTNSFTQVSTGEGKSLIVAGVAIAFALSRTDEYSVENKKVPGNKKIDVVTSNDVLALRDSNLSFADGGLKDLYEYFNITVANNCSPSVDKRTQAYNSTVVYGKLANFQRDYLLDEFYDSNIRNDRTMDLVIVDEVDSMLLDRGNNTLYLSHDIPGMEMLESFYVFVWEKTMRASIAQSDKPTIKKSIKAALLYDLYGTITKDDLDSIDGSLKDQPSEKNALWNYLIDNKVIDSHGRLLIIKNEVDKINYRTDLDPKIAFYFGNVLERKRCIKIPDHLMNFVDRHLDSWLDNALQALELKRDEDYVVDQDRTDTSPDLNPQVIIIDQDTGTDQISSQWDGALHQFIQLKEGCKLSHQSLKAIFISNATYILKYKKIAGASGTLGSKTERDFMEKKYNCFFFTIPTAFVKNFDMKPAKVFKSKGSWLQAITKEAKKTVLPEEEDKVRSLVIFCQSIKDANTLHHRLKSALASKIGASHIHCYTRDYEKFVFESESLQVGHVIIATNLAGRGTDIKISKQLRDNGGLHICLTFLPKNERIEEQAMGRAGRNGAPGSGIFLLYDETSTADKIVKWGAGKFLSLKEERKHWELQRISRLVDDFKTIEREEVFYEDILQRYSELKIQLTEKKCQNQEIQSICNSVLDRWALWLDETIEYLELSYFYYMKEFKKNLLPRFQLPDNDLTDISWMTPVRSIALGKYFATHKTTKPNLSTAVKIFDRLIESTDSFWYPAAYYYRAFTLLKEDLLENKTKFIQTLRICDTILNEHIDMQLNFYRKVKQSAAISDQNFSFSIVEAYQQQKDNTIKLLEFFIGSSRSLLGSHYCLVTDLEKDASDPPKKPGTINKFLKKVETFLEKKKSSIRPFEKTRKEEAKVHKICPNKVDKLFQSLFDNECLVCKLNDIDTAPKRSADIQRVANDYCISVSLEKKLESIFAMKLNEEEIEKELKTITPDLIPCTRKTFWNKLKKDGALLVLEMGLCPDMKCVIMLESECDLEPKFNREEAIKIDFGSSGYALYNPTYATRNDLLEEKKIMFRKKYIRDLLLGISYQEYRQRKKTFEFNQIARIDFEKLRTVDLTSFGRLGVNDFYRVNIIPAERDGIWTALISQQIIDEHGNLSLEYADQKFNYPSCPAYEEAVMRLLGRTFVAEIVRRHWLKSRDDPRFLKSINLLPLKPYRDMLGDLMSAHVISGARVTEDTTIKLEDEIKKIKGEDEEAYKCIVDFLKKRQAIYAAPRMKKYDVVLNFIERDIRMIADMNNISSELYDFGLVGFDHVINVKDRERSWKMVCVTSLISSLVVAFGGASLGVGAFLVYSKILNFGFCKDLLFMGGLSDILYAVTTILTRSHFTWADFGRQRIRSVMGKAEPIEMIKVIWEVYNSSDKTDVELRNAIRKTAHLVRCRRQGKTELMALNEPLLDNAISQLGVINQKNEFYFHSRLHSQCLLLCDFLIAKINKIIDKNSVKINETLTQLHRCQGKDKAQLLADAKIKAIVTIWFKDGCHWVSEVEATIKSKVVEIGKSRETGSSIFNNEPDSDIQSIEHILEDFSMRMRMVCKTLAHLQTFISDLNNDNHPTSSVANDFDVEENGRFKKGTITDLKSELARKAEKVVEKLTQKVHQITSDHLTQLAKTNPKLYAAFLYYV